MERIASIDIGSNTLRLLIAEKSKSQLHPLFQDREIVRLGRNFYPSRLLSFTSMENAIAVLKRFKITADREEVTELIAVGTGVLREAENTSVFLEQVLQETGISVRIIPGLEEARLMAKGVLSQFLSTNGETVIFDIGGGSTEFVFMKEGRMGDRISLPLGVVGLTEKYLKTDPPMSNESNSLRIYCRNILKKNTQKNDRVITLIGTAGTVTTLAAMDKKLIEYDPNQINGTVLTIEKLMGLSNKILSMPLKQRVELPGLEPERADVLSAGLLLVLEIMDHFFQKELRVSDAGLLEGLIV
jgi:exopolyphosphatase / guanosine-5'-triphosphate,3'-diphosphate pyrophosphatase